MGLSNFVHDLKHALDDSPLQLHHYAWIVAGVFAFGGIFVSFWIIVKHLMSYKQPTLQRYMIRIVFMVPVYVIGSYLSLVMREHAFYFTLIRDCYESYVLYMFFRLLIELAEGEENLISKLDYVEQVRCFTPFCCCHIKPGRIFLHRCKQSILQFVLLKPILAVIIFFLSMFGIYDEGSFAPNRGYLYMTLVYNISFTIALYFLVLFYESIKKILAKHKPLSKFLCIKAVVFFSYWQSIGIAVMVHFGWLIEAKDDWTISDVATGLQNFLICIEMFPLAFMHISSFGVKSVQKDMLQEGEDSPTLIQATIDAANVTDVFQETFIALKKGPKRNVVVGEWITLSLEEKKKHVVKEGWLKKRGEDLAKIWKTRYVLLIDRPKGLVYFKNNPFENVHLKPRGFIELQNLIEVKPHEKNMDRFKVVTAARKWHFKSHVRQEKQDWMDAIIQLWGGPTNKPDETKDNAVSLEMAEPDSLEMSVKPHVGLDEDEEEIAHSGSNGTV